MTLFNTNHKLRRQHAFRLLDSYACHTKYFFAGGFVVDDQYEDVDVFFETEADYFKALQSFSSFTHSYQTLRLDFQTSNAVTFTYRDPKDKVSLNIQLIKRKFGTPQEIFKTFDLNVPMQAILPNTTKVKAPIADQPLHIVNTNFATFRRFSKYIRRGDYTQTEILNMYKTVIDTYISVDTIVEDYYSEIPTKKPLNYLLALHVNRLGSYLPASTAEIHTIEAIQSYMQPLLAIHAPELLL